MKRFDRPRMAAPGGAGLVQFPFATPVIEVRDAMPGLFDTIVEAVRWVPGLG